MRRYLPVALIVVFAAAALLWVAYGRRQPPSGGPRPEAARPLKPQPEYLKVADEFMRAWAAGDARATYALLSSRMRELATEGSWAQLMAEVKLSSPQVVAHTGLADAAYVIYKVDAPQPKGATPVNGYSLLLRQQGGQWRVALSMPDEKVSEKYEDLKLAPATAAADSGTTPAGQKAAAKPEGTPQPPAAKGAAPAPAAGQGYVVTYQDESGQVATVTLPEL